MAMASAAPKRMAAAKKSAPKKKKPAPAQEGQPWRQEACPGQETCRGRRGKASAGRAAAGNAAAVRRRGRQAARPARAPGGAAPARPATSPGAPSAEEKRRAATRKFFARLRSLEAIVGADLRKRGSLVLMQAVDQWYSEAISATATDVSITNAAKAVITRL